MKARPIKDLLILLQDYFPSSNLKWRGFLCAAIYDMYVSNRITYDERSILMDYIYAHRPPQTFIEYSAYFFPEGELAPRIEFLNKLISEL